MFDVYLLLTMIPSVVQKQISSSLVREGQLFKRSKFLKVWQDKWLVLTVNYLFIFQDRNKRVLNDSIDLNQIKNYKSYVRKEDDVLTTCLKIRSDSNMYYLGFGSVLEKWTWVVTLERLMDMKVLGKSQYNTQEWITTKGFPSQAQFQGVSREKQKEDTLAKEVEKLKRQLEEQEKFFENALKQKYKELNVIEDKMKQREKHYAELNVKLNAALKEAEEKVAEAEEKVKQAELKTQDAENRIKIAEEKANSKQQRKTEYKKQVKNELPPLNHEIKSFYQHQMVESMLGFSLTSQQSANLALRTIIINESRPKVQAKKQVSVISAIFGSEKISEVQSILGYTIPPVQHTSIHTQGLIKVQQANAMVAEIIIDAIIINQLKEEINDLRAQLQKANQKIIQLSLNKVDKKDEYTHQIKQSHKFALVESILGYALSPSAHSNLHLKANIIEEDNKLAQFIIEKLEEISQNDAGNKIETVQSILGYSITPAQVDKIHTNGPIAQKEEVFEQQIYIERDNQMLRIRIESLQQQLKAKDRQLANLIHNCNQRGQRQEEQLQFQNQRLRKQLDELRLHFESLENINKDQITQNIQSLKYKDQMIVRLQAEILLLKQLLKESTQKDKQLDASPPLPPKIEYPPTGHTIKSSYQFQIIESMLGHSLPQAQRKNTVINTNIILQERPNIIKKSARQEKKREENEHIVQTVLGFSIPPSRSHEIHTGGEVQERIPLRVFDALKQQVELLRQQLNASENEIQRFKINNMPKIQVVRVPQPETGHTLRPSFRFEIAESMIGSSLSSQAKKNLHIRANFIQDQPIKQPSLKPSNKTFTKKSERHDNSKVDAVQTILGFGIPPLRYTEIHTEGIVPIKVVKVEVQESDLALDIMMLNEKIISLVANGQGLKQQLDILRVQLSKQKNQYQTLKEFNESTVKQAQKAYTQSERVKKLLEEKIVNEQSLNSQIKQQTERHEQQLKQRTKHIENQALLTAQIISLKAALNQLKQSLEALKEANESSKTQKEEKTQDVEQQQPKESIKEQALKAEINLLMLKIVKQQAKVHQTTAENDKLKIQIKGLIENETILKTQVQNQSKKVKEHELNSISKQQYEEEKRQLEELFKRNKQQITQKQEIIASLETEIKLKENNQAKEIKTTASIPPKMQLPPTNHTIRSVYQFEMVESMLGFALPRNEQEKVTLKTKIIVEQHPRIIKNIINSSVSKVKSPKNSNDESIQSVESVLGFSIPPSRSKQIHVGGKIEQNILKREVEFLRKQLVLAETEIERLKVNNASKNDIVKVSLPETGHSVRPGYKIDLVQSMLGFSLSSDAKKNMYIRANYIDDQPKQYPQRQVKNNAEGKKERKDNVDSVQTILGFAIPPFRYIEIHTDGIIPIKLAKVENDNKPAVENEQLNEQFLALKTSNQLLKQQLQAAKKTFSLQTELSQAQKSRLSDMFLQSQARHLQIQQDLAIKLKQYQQLYSQFQTKYNDIQSQPIVISPKKEQKQSENIVTDILKPSLLKAKSSKNQNVPVWVKVRPEEQQQIEKPAQIAKKSSEIQSSSVHRVSKVSQMKKLFEKMSSKKQ